MGQWVTAGLESSVGNLYPRLRTAAQKYYETEIAAINFKGSGVTYLSMG